MSAFPTLRRRLGLPGRRRRARSRPSDPASSLTVQLVTLVQVTVVGGLAFAGGFLGLAAMRALSWSAALAVLAGGGVALAAPLAVARFWQNTHLWCEVLERLHA
jgi:hypothetical protein